MAKIIGDISWVPQPGYPQFTGKDGSEQITMKFVGSVSTASENIPEYGSTFYDERYPLFNAFDELELQTISVKPQNNGQAAEITLTYSTPETSQVELNGLVSKEVEYQSAELDVPIESHPKYKTNWNHRLIAKSGVTTSPSWWTTATKTQISDADSKKYKWIKPTDQVPDGWYEMQPQQKKGVEAYKTYVPEVLMIKRSTSKKSLEKVAAKDGTKQTPPETFDRAGEWLQGASSLKKEGRYWVLRVPFQNSREIDSDIYD